MLRLEKLLSAFILFSSIANTSCKEYPVGENSEDTQTTSDISIESVKPLMARAGDMLIIRGKNFKEGVSLKFQEKEIENITFIDANTLEATMPEATDKGVGNLVLTYEEIKLKYSIFYAGSQKDYPISTKDSTEVCAGEKFYDASGDLITGTRVCADKSYNLCSGANQKDCVATDRYKTMDLGLSGSATALTSSGFNSAIASDKVFEFWDANGVRHQIQGDTDLEPGKIAAGANVFGIVGSAVVESHGNCTSDGSIGCVATSDYTTASTAGLSAKVKAGSTVAGVSGSLIEESHSQCSTDGAVGCVVQGPSMAAAVTSGIAAKIVSGYSVAGVSGSAVGESHTDCSGKNQTGCVATATYKTMDLSSASSATADLTSTNFNTSLSSSNSFEFWDSTGTRYQAAGDSDLVADKIVSGTNMFGVDGTSTVESHGNCTDKNQSGCVATLTYKTMDLSAASNMTDLTSTNFNTSLSSSNNFEFWDSTGSRYQMAGSSSLSVGNIKNGVSLFGILGDYPSTNYPLPSASATADLDTATFNIKIKSADNFEFWNSAGVRQTGSGDADIQAVNIKNGTDVFGTTGSIAQSCSYSNQATCTADSACQWSAGSCSIDPWNIRIGKTISGVSGALKTTCRNRVRSSSYNADPIPTSDVQYLNGTSLDWWDTISDVNSYSNFPTQIVSAWGNSTDCYRSVWQDLTADGSCDSAADNCMIKDKISGVIWSESSPVVDSAAGLTTKSWSESVRHCDDLNYGGYSDWRLPTENELLEAYVHGISDLAYKEDGAKRSSGSLDNNDYFVARTGTYYWSASSTVSGSNSYRMLMYNGSMGEAAKSSPYYFICVRN